MKYTTKRKHCAKIQQIRKETGNETSTLFQQTTGKAQK